MPRRPAGRGGETRSRTSIGPASSSRTKNAAIAPCSRVPTSRFRARRLAQCPHVAEHHLTPDLKEEILVLRNRRGKTSEGLAPLRAALARIAG